MVMVDYYGECWWRWLRFVGIVVLMTMVGCYGDDDVDIGGDIACDCDYDVTGCDGCDGYTDGGLLLRLWRWLLVVVVTTIAALVTTVIVVVVVGWCGYGDGWLVWWYIIVVFMIMTTGNVTVDVADGGGVTGDNDRRNHH